MEQSFKKIIDGYHQFRNKYVTGDNSIMHSLAQSGQQPKIMVVACCDSRVDPAVVLQCDPGDLFVVRNVANIVPPYEKDGRHHGTSAALEFGIRFLEVHHLIILGHSHCGGIHALLNQETLTQNDFIADWVSLIENDKYQQLSVDQYAKKALKESYLRCLEFPWIKERVDQKTLIIHTWFFDIAQGQILSYHTTDKTYKPL